VNTVSFAPDGRTLVAGGTDGTVQFLNLPDLTPEGRPLAVSGGDAWAWYDRTGNVLGLAPDRRPNTDGYRWFHLGTAPGRLATLACSLAGADITRAQWQRYVGDRPYQHVCSAAH
jgi:WD40 repeat protein